MAAFSFLKHPAGGAGPGPGLRPINFIINLESPIMSHLSPKL